MGVVLNLFFMAAALLGGLLLLRAYLWSLAISPRDPLVRFAWRFTDWLVNPVAYLVKPRGNYDWSSLAAAALVAVIQTLVSREATGFPMTPEAFLVMPVALMFRWVLDLLSWGLIIYCVMSFFAQRFSPYMALLGTLLDPLLRPVRRVIPMVGRFDLSPLVLFILISILQHLVMPASLGLFTL